MFHVVANLDQEERWLGSQLPKRLQPAIAAMSGLLQALAPADEQATIWTCMSEAWRGELPELAPSPHWQVPVLAIGTPPQIDLQWAALDAERFADRRFALALSHELGLALPGARELGSIGELEAHLAGGGASASREHAWVCKAPFSSAGRQRCFAKGREVGRDNTIWLERLFERGLTVCFEPYLHRVCDVAVCGVIGETPELAAPHTIHTDARGAFRGIALGPTHLEAGEHDQLVATAERVAGALRAAGYQGRFGLDAFVYDDAGRRCLHPICEINARWTFGHVAHALGARFGSTMLGFGPAPPAAKVLIQSARFAAWVA
ncbi:hypothetical protein BH11MYX1_BH11MYX1_57820 [soil metagenome]